MVRPMADYEKLRALLDHETYPHTYIHKFIGLNTETFRDGLERLEERFPEAIRVSERESGEGANFLAVTYELEAQNPDEIIELLRTTTTLADVKVIL